MLRGTYRPTRIREGGGGAGSPQMQQRTAMQQQFKIRWHLDIHGHELHCLTRYCLMSNLDHITQVCYPTDIIGELGLLAAHDMH
jgi:hypothetical protein